jgi:Lon protease-like protein
MMRFLISVLHLLILQHYRTASFRVASFNRKYSRLVLKVTGEESSDTGSAGAKEELPSLEELFGGTGVKYVLNNEGSFDTDNGVENMMIKPSQSSKKAVELIDIPIMPFDAPLFPGAREFLYIYEMRFRSLMNDAEKNGNRLGRCFISDNGAIGSIGSFCSIFEKRKMNDGKGFFIIEANSRFRIRKIITTKPYLRAQVELIDDIEIAGDSTLCENLCKEVYCELKTYLRIAKMQNADEDDAETIGLSPAIRDSRPLFALKDKILEIDGGAARHKAFSHACANLLATEVPSPLILYCVYTSSCSSRMKLIHLKSSV